MICTYCEDKANYTKDGVQYCHDCLVEEWLEHELWVGNIGQLKEDENGDSNPGTEKP